VTNDGLITIELDGHVVLSSNYQALVSGALGALGCGVSRKSL